MAFSATWWGTGYSSKVFACGTADNTDAVKVGVGNASYTTLVFAIGVRPRCTQ